MNNETLLLFKDEFWKDKRRLDIVNHNEQECLLKCYDNTTEKDTEISVINFILENGVSTVPEILVQNEKSVVMPYYKGIRIFNLLVVLDDYEKINPKKALAIKNRIMVLCEQKQSTIQQLLFEWRKHQNFRVPYSSEKIKTAIMILTDCLDIRYSSKKLNREINKLSYFMAENAFVPFRDSTTKNMLLFNENLFLPNFCDETERNRFLIESFDNGSIFELLSSPIIDFDFCSCINDTTPEDDVISLLFHERTWSGCTPNAINLTWNFKEDSYRAAVTFIIRFLRFGSRKAAYKLLHKNVAEKRFKYDDPCYYFKYLKQFVCSLCPSIVDEFPVVFSIIENVYKNLLTSSVDIDYFQESGLCINETPYIDVFPN